MKDRVKAPKYKQMQQPNPYVSLGFAHTKPAVAHQLNYKMKKRMAETNKAY